MNLKHYPHEYRMDGLNVSSVPCGVKQSRTMSSKTCVTCNVNHEKRTTKLYNTHRGIKCKNADNSYFMVLSMI